MSQMYFNFYYLLQSLSKPPQFNPALPPAMGQGGMMTWAYSQESYKSLSPSFSRISGA